MIHVGGPETEDTAMEWEDQLWQKKKAISSSNNKYASTLTNTPRMVSHHTSKCYFPTFLDCRKSITNRGDN